MIVLWSVVLVLSNMEYRLTTRILQAWTNNALFPSNLIGCPAALRNLHGLSVVEVVRRVEHQSLISPQAGDNLDVAAQIPAQRQFVRSQCAVGRDNHDLRTAASHPQGLGRNHETCLGIRRLKANLGV